MSESTRSLENGFDWLWPLKDEPKYERIEDSEEVQKPHNDPKNHERSIIIYLEGLGMWVLGLVSLGLIPAISAREDNSAHASQIGFALSCLCGVGLVGWGMIEIYDAWRGWRQKKLEEVMGIMLDDLGGKNHTTQLLSEDVTPSKQSPQIVDESRNKTDEEDQLDQDSQAGLDMEFSPLTGKESEDPAERRASESEVISRISFSFLKKPHHIEGFSRERDEAGGDDDAPKHD